jgi:hypothetical protein
MKAKKRRDKEARLIKKAVQSGDIQKDPIEDYYLDPYGRPIIQMLNEAPVETLGYKDRDLAADALNVLGVAAREGLGMLPVVGETLDAAEVAHAAKYGTDYYGDEISPGLLGGLTAAGYLLPNIIERPAKAVGRAIGKGLDTDAAKKIFDLGYDLYNRSFKSNPSAIESAKQNLMQFVKSDEYIDRILNSISRSGNATTDDIKKAKQLQQKAIDNISESTSDVVNSKEFMTQHYGDYFNKKGQTPPDFGGLAYRTTGGEPNPIKGRGEKPSIVLNERANRGAAAHELGHISLDEADIMEAAKSVDTPKITEEGKKLLEGQRHGADYFGNPDEIRARAFEVIDAAYEIGVKPDDLVDFWLEATGPNATVSQYRAAQGSIPNGLIDLINYFDEKELRNYLNKVWGALPVAGAGAVAATRMGSGDEEPTSYAKGGIMKAMKKSAKGGKIRVKKRDYKEEYKKFQSSDKMKKYRAKLNKYNRDNGTYGNGDSLDASHRGGKIAGYEAESKNRGRREKSRIIKNK